MSFGVHYSANIPYVRKSTNLRGLTASELRRLP